ncbi:MAG: IS5 family transposase [Isosphaeraceae bacterium]
MSAANQLSLATVHIDPGRVDEDARQPGLGRVARPDSLVLILKSVSRKGVLALGYEHSHPLPVRSDRAPVGPGLALHPGPQEEWPAGQYDRREVVNALLYVARTGCQWRAMPHDLPPGGSCTGTSWPGRRTARSTACTTSCGATSARPKGGGGSRRPRCSTASRSRRRKRGPRGYDAGKKVAGRKRHVVVDTLGLILAVVVHPADVQDRDGAKPVLGLLKHRFSRLRLVWADGGYAGQLVEWVRGLRPRNKLRLEIVKRSDDVKGFVVLPRRWVVERTFGWLGRCRRLSKDYEATTASSEAFVKLAMIHLMARRLTKKLAS